MWTQGTRGLLLAATLLLLLLSAWRDQLTCFSAVKAAKP
jgi:hypothetical protein